MGLFNFLKPAIEKKLENLYVNIIREFYKEIPLYEIKEYEIKKIVKRLLKNAKRACKEQGSLNLPLNFGDILLEKESTDERVKETLAKKRKEGVRDEDIRFWWNLHDLERSMVVQADSFIRMQPFAISIDKGMNKYEAAAKVRKIHPIYEDPDYTYLTKEQKSAFQFRSLTDTTGDDRPLPYELKDRINKYIVKKLRGNIEEHKRDIEKYSTFNALVREEIRKGNI